MSKIKIKKDDTVLVKTGNSKGSKGKVIRVYPKLDYRYKSMIVN